MGNDYNIAFENRTIALIGDSKLCKHFYLQFCAQLNIQYRFMFSIDTKSPSDDFFSGNSEIQCMPFKERLVREQGLLLILCCKQGDRKLYDNLLFNKGLCWGEDYIDYLYVVHHYQHSYGPALEERNIWIYGAGNNGKRFYQKNKDFYNIRGFISNYEEEKEVLGLPVIRPTDLLAQENFYVVICSEAEAEMSKVLCQMGLKGGEQYGFAQMLPKKLLVVMGTCQVVFTVKVLYRNKEFSTRYNAGIYLENMYQPCSDADNRRLKGYGSVCDIVFYNLVNSGSLEQRDYGTIITKYYQNADKISMPFYYFRGQLMQITIAENPYMLKMRNLYFWSRGDQEINQMIENGLTTEEIIESVLKKDYWPKQKILENFEQELKKIALWDRFSSFPIQGFIEENYRKMVIFDDGIHFCVALHLYLANEIAKYLGLKPISDQDTIEEIGDLQKGVIPVYPCVRQVLGMEMEDHYRFYNTKTEEIEYLDTEEYMRRYVRYVVNVREICGEIGTIFRY